MMYRDIDQLIEEIKIKFKEPYLSEINSNGDTSRYFKNIQRLFPELTVINQTDFNYSNCNSFDVILSKRSPEKKIILTIKVSHVVDAFCLYVVSYSSKNSAKIIDEESQEYFSYINKVRGYFSEKEFREINSKEFEMPIVEIDLELAEIATVGKCLFDDH